MKKDTKIRLAAAILNAAATLLFRLAACRVRFIAELGPVGFVLIYIVLLSCVALAVWLIRRFRKPRKSRRSTDLRDER